MPTRHLRSPQIATYFQREQTSADVYTDAYHTPHSYRRLVHL